MDAYECILLADRIESAGEEELRSMLADLEGTPSLSAIRDRAEAAATVENFERQRRERVLHPTPVKPKKGAKRVTRQVVYDPAKVDAARERMRRLDEEESDRRAAAEAVRSRLRHLERVAAAEYRNPGEGPLTALKRSYEED